MVAGDYSLTHTTSVSLHGTTESEEDIFFENLATFTLDNLEKARETLTDIMKGLNGVEKNKVAYVKDQVDKFIEQLKKAKKSNELGKVFKALGIAGVVLAALAAILFPSPMTIALFAVALVMTMEPLLAEAGGYDSVVQKGMSEMMKGLTDLFGPVGGAVVGAVALMVVMLLLVSAVSAGLSAASSAISQSTAATMQFLRQLPSMLQNFITGELTAAQQASILRVLEAAEACITTAQGGLQMAMARLNFEVANLMYAFQVDQALIDLIDNLTKSITQDATAYQEHINRLLEYLPQFFAPLNA